MLEMVLIMYYNCTLCVLFLEILLFLELSVVFVFLETLKFPKKLCIFYQIYKFYQNM